MKIAVVIPAFRVSEQIVEVVQSIGSEASYIIVVDDHCPENSGRILSKNVKDERLKIIYHEENKGVGGATIAGFKEALKLNVDIVVKLDGDGQMDVSHIEKLIAPIKAQQADFTKGNRFHNIQYIRQMPNIRLFGNSYLSLINKFVTGYWSIMDPTNGFIAISSNTLANIELDKLNKRYFFESDLLYRLSIHQVVIKDVPFPAKYGNENSSLNITKVFISFLPKYFNRYLKRIFYLYFIRDFNAGTVQLVFGFILFLFGACFGIYHWYESVKTGVPALAGTIMVAALPVILGFQLLLGFLFFDVNNQPKNR